MGREEPSPGDAAERVPLEPDDVEEALESLWQSLRVLHAWLGAPDTFLRADPDGHLRTQREILRVARGTAVNILKQILAKDLPTFRAMLDAHTWSDLGHGDRECLSGLPCLVEGWAQRELSAVLFLTERISEDPLPEGPTPVLLQVPEQIMNAVIRCFEIVSGKVRTHTSRPLAEKAGRRWHWYYPEVAKLIRDTLETRPLAGETEVAKLLAERAGCTLSAARKAVHRGDFRRLKKAAHVARRVKKLGNLRGPASRR